MKKGKQFDTMFRDFSMLDVSRILYKSDRSFAQKMDEEDPLGNYRNEFHFPKKEDGNEKIYFCGNSLGLASKGTEEMVLNVMEQWMNLGVKGHFNGQHPWVPFHLDLKEKMAKVVGAKASEVTLMNTLTVNLHLMMVSFYKPEGKRTKVLIEPDIFPSDRYAIESQIEWHGLVPNEEIIYIPKKEGQEIIEEDAIEKMLEEKGEEIALVILGGVNYYTGQLLDMKRITKAGHKAGCKVGFDLAHAAGNVPLNLHNDGPDFAVWCTYKYLNSGPGSIAGAFVHEKHHEESLPKLKGWWGHNYDIRFKMRDEFDPMPGAESWQISCQPILSLVPIKASLELFDKAGMKALRNKSILLTGYLEFLLKEKIGEEKISIITPNVQKRRGCQLSIFLKEGDKKVYEALTQNGVIVDWREPNVIRVAPTPLYNGYEEVYEFVEVLDRLL